MKVYAYIYNNKLFIVQNPKNLPPNISYQEFDVENTNDLYIENGQIKVKTPEQNFQEAKQSKLQDLDNFTTNYIYKYYPPSKQQSDQVDKDFYSTLLIKKFNYTYQDLAQKTYDATADIVDQVKTFQEAVQELSTDENGNELTYTFRNQTYPVAPVWEQLLKIALRTNWVKEVKLIYSQIKQQILQATTIDELNSISFDESTFPPFPSFEKVEEAEEESQTDENTLDNQNSEEQDIQSNNATTQN